MATYMMNGKSYPLEEAQYDMMVKVYRVDQKNGTVGSLDDCVISRGILRKHNVVAAHTTSGNFAYVLFTDGIVRRFVITKLAGEVRDAFDQHKKLTYDWVELRAPRTYETLAGKRKINKKAQERHQQRIKDGTVKHRVHRSRKARLNIDNRARPQILYT